MFICKVATEYTLACGEGVPSPANPQRVDDTMLTTSHVVPSVSMTISKIKVLYDGSKGSIEANECKDKTGGWTLDGYTAVGTSKLAQKTIDSMVFDCSSMVAIGTNNQISVDGYSKICVEYISTVNPSQADYPYSILLVRLITKASSWTSGSELHKLPYSPTRTVAKFEITSDKYIGLIGYRPYYNDAIVYKVWLEP